MSAINLPVAVTSSGALVAAVPGYAIVVKGYVLTSAAGTVAIQNGSTALGTLIFPTGGGMIVAPAILGAERGWFQTSANTALNISLTTTTAVDGHILYELISQ
jgi:hypothetical protein